MPLLGSAKVSPLLSLCRNHLNLGSSPAPDSYLDVLIRFLLMKALCAQDMYLSIKERVYQAGLRLLVLFAVMVIYN